MNFGIKTQLFQDVLCYRFGNVIASQLFKNLLDACLGEILAAPPIEINQKGFVSNREVTRSLLHNLVTLIGHEELIRRHDVILIRMGSSENFHEVLGFYCLNDAGGLFFRESTLFIQNRLSRDHLSEDRVVIVHAGVEGRCRLIDLCLIWSLDFASNQF
jgi:hypothetical protein